MSRTPRTQRTDGEVTRKRILEAAGGLLAEAGFAETTNKAIAAKAGVDLASINYHFGSRAGLYQAVLIEAHSRIFTVDQIRELAESSLPAKEKLRKLLEVVLEGATSGTGWHAQVMAREVLSPSSHLEALADSEVASKLGYGLQIACEITGIPREDPALLRCLISAMAPCAMLMIVQGRVPSFAKKVIDTPREVMVDHLYHFAIGGIEAINAQRRAAGAPDSANGAALPDSGGRKRG